MRATESPKRGSFLQGKISSFFHRGAITPANAERVEQEELSCPVCSRPITKLSKGLRNAHVNKCLETAIGPSDTDVLETDTELPVVRLEDIEPNANDAEDVVAAKILAADGSIPVQDVCEPEAKKEEDDSQDFRLISENRIQDQTGAVESMAKRSLESTVTTKTQTKRRRTESQISSTNSSSSLRSRSPPFFKLLDLNGQKIGVDAFCYGEIPGVKTYFLSHFHSDHYGGLSKSWTHGHIYCTEATANLCEMYLNVKSELLRPLPLNEWTVVDGIEVLLIDANHCPGAAIILFKDFEKTILHCGDFRASRDHIERLSKARLDIVYLDTTYLGPSHCFPDQSDVIKACGDYALQLKDAGMNSSFFTATIDRFFKSSSDKEAEKNKPLILVGTYTIGKEKVAINLARALKTTIFAQRRKMDTLRALNDSELNELLSDNGFESGVHLVSMRDLNWPNIFKYYRPLNKIYSHCLAFLPTGWNYHPKKNSEPLCPEFKSEDLRKCRQVKGRVHLFRVPYSEHSSFTELRAFCTELNIKRIIPTVNMESAESRERMDHWLNQWLH